MRHLNRIEDIDLYLVGAFICFAVGGNKTGSILLIFAFICLFGKSFVKGLKNEK